MELIVEILLVASMSLGSWGFEYGYTFDNACFERDFFIQRQVGINETFVITFHEDGTADLIRDDETASGTWTNQDGLEEYRVSFPELDLVYTMEIETRDWDCADEGMLILTDEEQNSLRTWNFSPVWECSECSEFNAEDDNFCSQCGEMRPTH